MDDTTPAGRTRTRRRARAAGNAARATDVLVPYGGGALTVRPAGPADTDAAAALHGRCAKGTLRQRYRGPATGADDYLPHLLSPHSGHSLAALSGDGRMAALGHPLRDGDEAEVTLLVADSWQGPGVGAGMLRRLGARRRAPAVTG